MRRILLVDDEINVLHALQRTLRRQAQGEHLGIDMFTNPFEALARCCECNFDLVISDYRMPQMSGIELLSALREVTPDTVRMILSASTEFDTVMSAINEAEVFRYLSKPWQDADLQDQVRLALIQRDKLVGEQHLANQRPPHVLTPQELEAKRLEEEEPGIMQVKWAPDGSIFL